MKTLINEVVNREIETSDNKANFYEQILMEGLQELNAIERKTIFLRYWIPCSIDEIAAELNVRRDTADRLLNGSIEKLRYHFWKNNLSSSPYSNFKS